MQSPSWETGSPSISGKTLGIFGTRIFMCQRPAVSTYSGPDATNPQDRILFLEDPASYAWWDVAILLYQSQFSPYRGSFAVDSMSLNSQDGNRPVRHFKDCLRSEIRKIIFYVEFSFTVFVVKQTEIKIVIRFESVGKSRYLISCHSPDHSILIDVSSLKNVTWKPRLRKRTLH